MGFFSWLTADTRESIMNQYAAKALGAEMRTVYLLQPDGKEPIAEPNYEGYGVFGGVRHAAWVAEHNLPAEKLAGLDDDAIEDIGITLDCGNYYVDTETGKKWTIFHKGPHLIDPEIKWFNGSYQEIIPEFGMTGNELITSGRFERKTFVVKTPLKFSFDKDAVYEDLAKSHNCPHQGYFYDQDEDEEYDEEE